MDKALQKHSNGLFEEAILLYDLVLIEEPGQEIALYNKASLLMEKNAFSESASLYRQLLGKVLDPEKRSQVLCSYGRACFASDQGEEAKRACAEMLAMGFASVHELLVLGALGYEHGMVEQAEACYERVCALDSDNFAGYYNLGLIRYEQNRYEDAVALYQKAALINELDPDLLFNLGLAWAAKGEQAEALLCYHDLLKHSEGDVEIFVLMADCYRKLHQLEEAISCYRSALGNSPLHGPAWAGLGVIFNLQDRRDEAIQAFTNAKESGYDPEGCTYMLAALTGNTLEKPPENYVEQLFDNFADNFEEKLTKQLGYNVPQLIREELEPLLPPRVKHLLDLGCGTGLIAEVFADRVDQIQGIDLSAGMLVKAKEKKLYSALYKGDIVEYLDNCSESFDLIVASDVLNYLGELESFFRSVAPVLDEGGRVAFTVESGEVPKGNYVLQPNGRYIHHPDYIKNMGKEVGLEVELCRSVKLRMEKGSWVMAHLFVFTTK